MATLEIDAGRRTEDLLQFITAEVDDATLDAIGVERRPMKGGTIASEPFTAAATLTLATTLVVAVGRIIERWLEKAAPARAAQGRRHRLRPVRRGGQGARQAEREERRRLDRLPAAGGAGAEAIARAEPRSSLAGDAGLRLRRRPARVGRARRPQADDAERRAVADGGLAGLDAGGARRFRRRRSPTSSTSAPKSDMDSLLVVRHGRIVVDAYYAPVSARHAPPRQLGRPKAVVGTLAGIAVQAGEIASVDEPVLDSFPLAAGRRCRRAQGADPDRSPARHDLGHRLERAAHRRAAREHARR